MVFIDKKTGKLKIVNTLTKAGGFTKKAGESAIILKSDDYIIHPRIDQGKTITQQDMRRSGYTDKMAESANKRKAKQDEYKLDPTNPNHREFIETSEPILKKYLNNFTPSRLRNALKDLFKITEKGTKEASRNNFTNWGGKYNFDFDRFYLDRDGPLKK
jgi:hypothetical protein